VHQNGLDGEQAGDPKKTAAAMIRITNEPDALLNLFLGADAYDLADRKITAVQNDLETRKALTTTSTAF